VTGTNRSSEGLDAHRRKLFFRSWHRGTRELDLILGRFADAFMSRLDERDLADYERLLEVPDPELYAWVTGTAVPPNDYDTAVLQRLRAFYFGPGEAGEKEC
jgi:antitoxin CptB